MKKELKDLIETMTDTQQEYVYKFLKATIRTEANPYPAKKDLMQVAYTEKELWHVDSAYPITLIREIEKFWPNINQMCLVYDYNRQPYGELVSLPERILKQLANLK